MPSMQDIFKTYGQIKELDSFNSYMFIGPHPDDIEFGCGGLISKLKNLNKQVVYVIATDGAAGSQDENTTAKMLKEIRKKETLDAANFMNVKNVEFLDLPDGGIFEVEDVIERLAPMVLKYNPEILFAPDSRTRTECHSDHIIVGEAVRRLTQIISHKESLIRHHVDVSDYDVFPNNITLALYFSDDPNKKSELDENNLNEKIQSIMLHKSQTIDPAIELMINYFKLKAMNVGQNTTSGLAEDYQVLIPLVQHVYSEGVHYV